MNSEEYKDEELLELFSNLQTPFEKGSEEIAKSRVFERIESKKANSFGWLKIAAGVLFLCGAALAFLSINKTEITAENGMAKQHELPCGSVITLKEGNLSYQPFLWKIQRNLDFDGKAHFEVAEGNSFTVNSSMGSVAVTGTAFTVWSDEDDLFVHCESGSVDVDYLAVHFELELNDFCRIDDSIAMDGELSSSQLSSILNEESLNFEDVPLSVVLLKLENAFNIEIRSDLGKELRYTGEFSGQSLEEDLDILTKTFNAEYSFDEKGAVFIKH